MNLKPRVSSNFSAALHQSYVSLVDKVGERETLVLVLLGNTDNETQVGLDEFLLGTLSFGTSLVDSLGELYLLLEADHRLAAYFYKVFIQCLTGTVGDALLNF